MPELKYGPHQWSNTDGTGECIYGCGCHMGRWNSGGPVDPLGACPNNLELTLEAAKEQILKLTRRAEAAEAKLAVAEAANERLGEDVKATQAIVNRIQEILRTELTP